MVIRVEHVFVYGTLREGFENPGRDILTLHGEHLGEGTVLGALYDVGSFPALHPAEDARPVLGDVYELVQEPDVALERLDRYEGASGPSSLPYERREMSVELSDGRQLDAWTYVWTEDVSNLDPIPSGDYLSYVHPDV